MGLIDKVDVVVNGAQDSSKALVEYNTVILKQNIRDSRNMLTQQMMSQMNTKYVIKWAYTLAENIVLPKNCLIEFDGGSIKNDKGNSYTLTGDNTILIYSQELEDVVKGVELEGTFIHKNCNVVDEEDLTVEHSDLLGIDTLKLANRDNTDGMGYVILRKNKSFAEQVTKENTIYEIRYDFDLNGAEITIPKGCVLDFQGGNIKNGTINGKGLFIKASPTQIFDLSINVNGYSGWFYPEWYGAVGDGNNDDTSAIQKLNGKNIFLSEKEYLCTNLEFNSYTNIKGLHKFNSCLKQARNTTGDFIRLVNWFAGTIDTLRVEGNSTNIRNSNTQQGLIKVVNFTYTHKPEIGDWEDRDTSTNYSRLNNILIRNAAYSGLVVLGKYEIDDGKETQYNWIHHFGDIHIVNANEYGIFDSATDNLWQFINVTHCGWANIYCIGSAEQFSTLKLDGETGFNGSNELTESELSSAEYKYAGLIILGQGNQFINLEVQSPLQVGIKLQGSNNVIQGDVNNWRIGVNDKLTDEHKFPALQFLSRKVENNIIQLATYPANAEASGVCPIYWANDVYLNAHYYTNNNIHIEYKNPDSNFNYRDFIDTLSKLEAENNVVTNVKYNIQKNVAISKDISNALDKSPNLYIAYKTEGGYTLTVTKEEWSKLVLQGIKPLGIYVDLGSDSFVVSPFSLETFAIFSNSQDNLDFIPFKEEGDAYKDFSGVESTILRRQNQSNSPKEDLFHVISEFKIEGYDNVDWYVPSAGEAFVISRNRNRINEYLKLIGGNIIHDDDVIATSTVREIYSSFAVICSTNMIYPYLQSKALGTRPITKPGLSYNNTSIFSGTTDELPTTNRYIGRFFYNKTLNKPIWWTGTNWVDATGASI